MYSLDHQTEERGDPIPAWWSAGGPARQLCVVLCRKCLCCEPGHGGRRPLHHQPQHSAHKLGLAQPAFSSCLYLWWSVVKGTAGRSPCLRKLPVCRSARQASRSSCTGRPSCCTSARTSPTGSSISRCLVGYKHK